MMLTQRFVACLVPALAILGLAAPVSAVDRSTEREQARNSFNALYGGIERGSTWVNRPASQRLWLKYCAKDTQRGSCEVALGTHKRASAVTTPQNATESFQLNGMRIEGGPLDTPSRID
jgi:hypothetical protein